MNTILQVSFMFLAAIATTAAGSPASSEEFRVASMLFAGAVGGTVIGVAISETETKRRLITRGLIAIFAGPGLMTMIDYYADWMDLSVLPFLLLAFFGTISAIVCFFVGFAFVKRVRNDEDKFAADAMKKTFGKSQEIKDDPKP